MPEPVAIVGMADSHAGAVLMTVAAPDVFVDRRRIELVDAGLPKYPHHHDAQKLPLAEGVALVARVRVCAEQRAREALEQLARDLTSVRVAGIALRRCQPLPETVEERLTSYRAQNVADWVMYRQVLAEAARARGWSVAWFEPKTVFAEAARALQLRDLDSLLDGIGRSIGPPWRKEHKLAMAAAIAALGAIRAR